MRESTGMIYAGVSALSMMVCACAAGGGDTTATPDMFVPSDAGDAGSLPDSALSDSQVAMDGSVDASSGDAGSDDAGRDAAAPDAMTEVDAGPTRCDWSTAPAILDVVALASLNSTSAETDPFVTADGNTIYFASTRTGDAQIFTATRTPGAVQFGTPTEVAWANSSDTELGFQISHDGLDAYLCSNRSGGVAARDIFRAHRDDVESAFGAFVDEPNINSIGHDENPHVSANGRHMYMTNDSYSTMWGTYQIVLATRTSASDPFGAPAPLAGIVDTTSQNMNATVTEDETTIVFASTRPGDGSDGNMNIWYATRASVASDFGAPSAVPAPINSAVGNDYEPFISLNGCEIYFVSDRDDAQGDIYVARLAP